MDGAADLSPMEMVRLEIEAESAHLDEEDGTRRNTDIYK